MSGESKDHRSDGKKKQVYQYNKGFVGLEPLKGNVFSYGTLDQSERFIKTSKVIAEYVGTEYRKEMWTLVSKKEETTFKEPVDPGKDATKGQLEKYKMELKAMMDDEKKYKKEKAKVFRIVMGQCLAAMKNKVESLPEYPKLEENDDVIELLAKMEGLVYSTDNVQYEYWTMQSAMRKVMTLGQEPRESLVSFSRRFLAQVEVTEGVWGSLIPTKMKGKATDLQEEARNKYLACVFLAGVDRQRYKKVVDDLNNDFLSGTTNYPADVPGMLQLLSNRRGGGGSSKQVDAIRDGIQATSFMQRKNIKCWKCGKEGHVARECPKRKNKRRDEADDDSTESGDSAASGRSNTGTRVGWSGLQVQPSWAM